VLRKARRDEATAGEALVCVQDRLNRMTESSLVASCGCLTIDYDAETATRGESVPSFDIAPFALPRCPANERWFEDPRDIEHRL